MGLMKALLVFDSVSNMETALASDLLRSHFLEVRKWSCGEANRTRLCWIEVTGLPVHGWSKENMWEIGEVWGRAVKVVIGRESFEIFVREVNEIVLSIIEEGKDRMEDRSKAEGEAHKEKDLLGIDKENGKNGSIPAIVLSSEAVMRGTVAEEDEESKVGETQPGHTGEEGAISIGPESASPIDRVEETIHSPSPTKTKTLEDDRCTKQVMLEWEKEYFMKPNNVDDLRTGEIMSPFTEANLGNDTQPSSPSISIPPGFERAVATESGREEIEENIERNKKSTTNKGGKQPKKTILRLNDPLKEKERRHKEARKQKRGKQRIVREEREAGYPSSTEDKIEDIELKTDKTWGIGRVTGLATNLEDRARKYLKEKTEDVVKQDPRESKKKGRPRKQKGSQVGASENLCK
ncbi:hypothetical protein PIB30_079315 [Stylosanthes scabra]|uniref:DUF4283 domain-containing protein n=1 Tax=Stylosanthes scabra TaxID=79078 RepID=A0ABU6QQS6_9FABA|nr:hypothetical protein [Stylosanthes scabra]